MTMSKKKYKVKIIHKIKWWLFKFNIFRFIRNYFRCKRYPFIRSRNVWTGKPCGYGHTWYDAIPYGWRKAFGKKFLKELKIALKKEGRLKEFRFHDIKEKWGELCIYHNGVGKYSEYVINKYEILSLGYCINCGRPVRYVTEGWVEYICEHCKNKSFYKDAKNCQRLTKDDIPYSIQYDKNGQTKIDYKEKYDIDFIKLWDLK